MFTNIFSKPIFRLSVVILVNENIFRTTPVICKEVKHRSFARWTARKPSKAILPDGSIETEEFYKSEYSSDEPSKSKKSIKHDYECKNSEVTEDIMQTYKSESPDYVVLDENDSTFSKLMLQVGNRKMRRKHNLIMLEGKRLNMEAIQAGLRPKKLFFTQKSILDELELLADSKIPLYKLPYKTIKLWSKLDTPPGIIGFYNIPKEDDIVTEKTIPVKVLCDNVRDPGNMGSIIRVAASAGCKEVILIKGCTDPWDNKVLRAASGGHFHIPIKMDFLWEEHQDFLNPSDFVFLADNYVDRKDTFSSKLPQQMYYNVNYVSPSSVVIVIGGETEGLSYEAFNLAFQHHGSRLYIPLSNCMESLNSGCALSVILFEIKKQFSLSGKSLKVNKAKHISQLE